MSNANSDDPGQSACMQTDPDYRYSPVEGLFSL